MAPLIVLQGGSVRTTTGPTFDSCDLSNRSHHSFLGQQLAFKPRSNPSCQWRLRGAPVSALNGPKGDGRGDDVVNKEALQEYQSGEFEVEESKMCTRSYVYGTWS